MKNNTQFKHAQFGHSDGGAFYTTLWDTIIRDLIIPKPQ